MQELVEEHKYGRELTGRLVAAKDAVVGGDTGRLDEVLEVTGKLVEFYPEHIRKEDKVFFPETERHYDKAELDAMLKEFYDFDMQMIHEKYVNTVEALESQTK
jgi:hemerythrin-like domain-containing protein